MVVARHTVPRSLGEIREALRADLVHSLRWGHTLVLQLLNSAPAFVDKYCDDTHFPAALFDARKVAALTGHDATADAAFSGVLRPADTADSAGMLTVPASFRVVVTSTFKEANFEALLGDALPLNLVQPVVVLDSQGGDVTEQPGAPKAPQLQGDRMSLFLQS